MRRSYVVNRILGYYPHLDAEDVVKRLEATFVSIPRRYMYFSVAKAACTTMRYVLHMAENFPPVRFFVGEQWVQRREEFIHERENLPLPSLVDLDDVTQREVLESPDFLRMTVVRNPYSRLVSAWKDKALLCEPYHAHLYLEIKGQLPGPSAKSLISFEEFVDYIARKVDLNSCDSHWRRQVDHLFFKALHFDHVGKVEKLGETLQHFQQHLGVGESFPECSKNVSGSPRTAEFTPALADRIYSLYQEDFEAFRYDKGSWMAQKHAASPTGNHDKFPEEKFYDEIVERNIVIYHLYQERDQLRARLRRTPFGIWQRGWKKLRRGVSLPWRREVRELKNIVPCHQPR